MKAVVLTSGGLDSATVLAMAHAAERQCYALSFDYGQRHRAELSAAARVAASFEGTVHKTVSLDLRGIGGSALTDDAIDVPVEPTEGIPVTYVPARNTVFLSIALGWAEVIGASEIYIGVNAVDYSGYPDCRPDFIEAFGEVSLKQGDTLDLKANYLEYNGDTKLVFASGNVILNEPESELYTETLYFDRKKQEAFIMKKVN